MSTYHGKSWRVSSFTAATERKNPALRLYVVLNLLRHQNQNAIVAIVNGIEIAQYIQNFPETTQAS